MCDNWNEIVDILKNSSVSNKQEFLSDIQSCFRLLGWKKTNGSMLTNYKIDNSLMIDIALVYSSKTSCLPVYAMPLCAHIDTKEIFNKLNCKALILIGGTIAIYWKNNNTKEPICVYHIPLVTNDEVGFRFIDLLQADKFNEIKFNSFCEELGMDKLPINRLHKSIVHLIENPLNIKSIVKEHFVNEGFDEELLEKEFQHIQFNASLISSSNSENTLEKEPITHDNTNFSFDGKNYHSKRNFVLRLHIQFNASLISSSNSENTLEKEPITHDNTNFSFDGKNYHSKRNFVLRLIKQYVKDNPNTTFDDLEKVFPSDIISKNRGVVRPLTLVRKWIENNPDVEKRYCMKSDEIITLKDGMQVVVHNQWGTKHFPAFLEIAKKLYHIQSDKPYEFELKTHSGIKISTKSFNSFNKNKTNE